MNIREWTLPVYTILTQLSVGALLVIWIIRIPGKRILGKDHLSETLQIPLLIAFSTSFFAIAFAHLHLSVPYRSILALRNLGSSWLSRELLSNLIYICVSGLLLYLLWFGKGKESLRTILGWFAILAGFATDYCMSRIYLIPSQPAWNSWMTSASFFLTALILGVLAVPVFFTMEIIFRKTRVQGYLEEYMYLVKKALIWLAGTAVILTCLAVVLIIFQTRSLNQTMPVLQASWDLLMQIYQPLLIIRLVLMPLGAVWLVVTAIRLYKLNIGLENLLQHVYIACLLVMVEEILGRFLFYAIHVRIGL